MFFLVLSVISFFIWGVFMKSSFSTILIIVVVVLVSVFVAKNAGYLPGLQSASGYQYVEERCVDVQPYKDQGYSSSGFDTSCVGLSCEEVSKNVVTGASQTTSGIQCSCQHGCIDGPDRCNVEFGSPWVGVGCSGTRGVCMQSLPDVKGGCEEVEGTCTFTESQVLVMESFVNGGEEPMVIDRTSLRYPLVGVCKAKPVTIMTGQQLQSSTTILDDLVAGRSFSLNQYQSALVFYVTDVNENTSISPCQYGEAWSANTFTCSPATPIVTACTQGISVVGLGVCALVGTVTDCPVGSEKRIYENGTMQCIEWLPTTKICSDPEASWYDSLQGCVVFADNRYSCPSNSVFWQPTPDQCALLNGDWLACPGCPDGQSCPGCPPARCSAGQACLVNKTKEVYQWVNESGQTEPRERFVCPPGTRLHDFTDGCVLQGLVTQPTCKSGYVLVSGDRCVKYEVMPNQSFECDGELIKKANDAYYCKMITYVNYTTCVDGEQAYGECASGKSYPASTCVNGVWTSIKYFVDPCTAPAVKTKWVLIGSIIGGILIILLLIRRRS